MCLVHSHFIFKEVPVILFCRKHIFFRSFFFLPNLTRDSILRSQFFSRAIFFFKQMLDKFKIA